MKDKMASLSPKIELINHFDNLINRIDIDIEQCTREYKEDQALGELKHFSVEDRNSWRYLSFKIEYFDSNESSKKEKYDSAIKCTESTKVIDYLNQVRQRTIGELKIAQEDSLKYLKDKSCDLNHVKDSKDIEEMKSRLFANKFYFQVLYKRHNFWVFNLFTIVADFYLTPFEISFLE